VGKRRTKRGVQVNEAGCGGAEQEKEMEELSSLEKASSFLTIPGFELEEQIRSPEPSHTLFLARRVPTLNAQLPYRSPSDGASSNPLVFLDFGPAKELEHEKDILVHLNSFYQRDETWKKYIPTFEGLWLLFSAWSIRVFISYLSFFLKIP